jgi:two-component system OmpR family sensor kinase
MLARLQAAFARERAFVADASHELRTPLAILKTELELAGRGARTNAELSDAVRSAGEEVDRLTRLAEDLLVLARTEGGRVPVRPEPVALEPLVREVVGAFESQARAAGRGITSDSPDGMFAPIDPLRLRQALGNLIENALRHGAGDIRVYARRSNGDIELHVADQGEGFPPEFLPHAFERFTRGDPARTRGGSGLGLAIVEAIARGHGGSVHARNTAGGSDVWLVVPDQSARRASGSTAQSPPNSSTASRPDTTAAVSE